ncbi:hypothetical protein PGTUg99_011763 [Puccinia graminis f. sp. tritici]|uniref:SRR1-like domain-containing protein n=1 Tax=Puccinia graminis f. sp. tritici TaxID=56615 RepID=A0A5B0R0D3_PUCGR|nr:hypothetical protein PGTUg99_011763 [Puccinia graminis f. sp. tritici]
MQKDIEQTVGFQYVEQRSTKKNRKRRNNGKHSATLDLVTRAPLDLSQHLENRRSAMEKSQWLSLSSTWFAQCLNDPGTPGPPRKITCLALGSFSPDAAYQPVLTPGVASCTGIHGLKQSQFQLVFLLDVILPILSAHQRPENPANPERQIPSPIDMPERSNLKVSFYDPAFTEKDKENLRNLGHVVLDAIRNPVFAASSLHFFTCRTPPRPSMNVLCAKTARQMMKIT